MSALPGYFRHQLVPLLPGRHRPRCRDTGPCFLSCSIEDEGYFAALIRMYGRSLELVSSLPPAERSSYLDRLGRLRSRGRNVGWGVEEEFNSLWYASALDEHDGD